MVVKRELDSGSDKTERKGTEASIDRAKVGSLGNGAEKALMPDLAGLSMRNALSRIEGKGLIIKVSGNGRVVEQTPRAGAVVEKGDICYLKFQSPL